MELNTDVTRLDYNPGRMLDLLNSHMKLKSDVALSRKLNIPKSSVDRMRRNEISIDATMLVLMHEASGLQTSELRMVMGDRRKAFRISAQYAYGSPNPATSFHAKQSHLEFGAKFNSLLGVIPAKSKRKASQRQQILRSEHLSQLPSAALESLDR